MPLLICAVVAAAVTAAFAVRNAAANDAISQAEKSDQVNPSAAGFWRNEP